LPSAASSMWTYIFVPISRANSFRILNYDICNDISCARQAIHKQKTSRCKSFRLV
jgi:hypothetical protein